ncbi:unnamed protein product, partial [Didymodactylos carnosus]
MDSASLSFMSSPTRRSTRQSTSKAVKFIDPLVDEEDDGAMDFDEEIPSNENTFNVKEERFSQQQKPDASGSRRNDSDMEDEWTPVQREEGETDDVHDINSYAEASSSTPFNNTTTSQNQLADSSVYDFSEVSAKKKNSVNVNWKDVKPQNLKANRDTKHMCPYCNYCTGKKYLLQRHLKSHSTERPHKCTYCSNAFKTTSQLQNHVNTHLGIKPFQCKFCDYKFTTSGELIRHVRYKHTLEKPHKCTECGYATVELSKLRRHIRTHTGEKPYTCQFCSYASPDTFKLKRHLRVHTGERPYECTICKFRFTQSNSLKAHMLTHQTNAPKFQCQYCPTILTRKSDLKHHIIKKHQNEHLLYCQECDLDFPNERSLHKHEQTKHHGQSAASTYACSMCAFSTHMPDELEEHMNNMHRDERTFQCNECGLMYATRGDLRQHTTKVHRCGVYANVAGAGLSLRPPTNYIPAKIEHRPITTPRLHHTIKEQQHQIYRCTLCSKTFATLRTLEHHTYDVHNIDPYDNDLQDNEQIAMIQVRGQQHGQNSD